MVKKYDRLSAKIFDAIDKLKSAVKDVEDLGYNNVFIAGAQIVDKPKGEQQDDGVFVDQKNYVNFEEVHFGNLFFPLSEGKFLKIFFDEADGLK